VVDYENNGAGSFYGTEAAIKLIDAGSDSPISLTAVT
jgi:hypothetical protein